MSASYRVDWDTKALSNDAQKAALEALIDGAEFILDRSNAIAPIDEGDLIRSGAVAVDTGDNSVNVFYDTPYAVRQHEDLSLRHSNGRRAKFLESAMRANKDKVIEFVASAIRKVIE